MKKKLVYVASPVSQLHKCDGGWLKSLEFAQAGCKRVIEMGGMPLSPVLAFDGVYDERTQRDEIMHSCYHLLECCDEMLVVKTQYKSEGIAQEIKWAKELGITIIEMEA